MPIRFRQIHYFWQYLTARPSTSDCKTSDNHLCTHLFAINALQSMRKLCNDDPALLFPVNHRCNRYFPIEFAFTPELAYFVHTSGANYVLILYYSHKHRSLLKLMSGKWTVATLWCRKYYFVPSNNSHLEEGEWLLAIKVIWPSPKPWNCWSRGSQLGSVDQNQTPAA